MTPTFDVGILLDDGPASVDELVRRIELVEQAAPDIILVSDHLDSGGLDPFVLLALLAGHTTARLGTYVASAALRHPVEVARLGLTLATLTAGRFRLGVGAGWRRSDADAVGRANSPGSRRRLFEEHLEVLCAVLRGSPVAHDGPSYRCHLPEGMAAAGPRPAVLVGASGPRMLEVAARRADVVGLAPPLDGVGVGRHASGDITLGGFERMIGQLDEVTDRPIGRSLLIPVVRIADGDRVLEMMARASGASQDDLATSPYVLVGAEEAMVDRVRGLAARFRVTEFVFPEKVVVRCPGLIEALRRP